MFVVQAGDVNGNSYMSWPADELRGLMEFAQTGDGDSGDYLRTLASAWYNDVYNTGNLQKGIKSQEDVEKILRRGVVCPDGKTRKYYIDYNSDFNGVDMVSHDYYEHSDYGPNGEDVDGRTGKPWSVYDHIEYSDDQLDEGNLKEFAPGGQGGNGPFDYGSAIVKIGEDFVDHHQDSAAGEDAADIIEVGKTDRKSTRLNSSHT